MHNREVPARSGMIALAPLMNIVNLLARFDPVFFFL
jgi:hypothetical protein